MKQKLFVIKIGGNVIDNEDALESFLTSFSSIDGLKLLVHGGGKLATRVAEALNIEQQMINGRRVTNAETLKVVSMVYGGFINKNIVAQLQAKGVNAIGLTGADANVIPASKRPLKNGIDYGFVGDINSAEISINKWQLFINNGLTPIVAPLTHDGNGHLLNTNADTIASSLAVALSAHYDVRLIYCFEKKGVLEDVADEASVITFIDKQKYALLLQENKLFEGILPKLENAFAAIDAGVKEVLIGHAEDLLKNTTHNTSGTLITA